MGNPVKRLNELAERHGLEPINDGMDPGQFMEKGLVIMLAALGLSEPPPKPNPAQVLTPVIIK